MLRPWKIWAQQSVLVAHFEVSPTHISRRVMKLNSPDCRTRVWIVTWHCSLAGKKIIYLWNWVLHAVRALSGMFYSSTEHFELWKWLMTTNPTTFSLFHFRWCVSNIKHLLDFPVRVAVSRWLDSVSASEQTGKRSSASYQNGASYFIMLFPTEMQVQTRESSI